MRKLFVLIPLLALIACAPQVETNLYMQDLLEVVEGKRDLFIPSKLRIPENGRESCKKRIVELAEKLRKITPVESGAECITDEHNDDYSEFTLPMPVTMEDAPLKPGYLITLRLKGNSHALDVSIELSRSLKEVREAIGRGEGKFKTSFHKIEHPKFIFNFENDIRDNVGIIPNYIFIDGKSGLPGDDDKVVLHRREHAKLELSDVVAAHVGEANRYKFATFYIHIGE